MCHGNPETGNRGELAPHPALRGRLPPRGKAQRVEKGVLTPWPPLRGGSARRRWGRELYGARNISGYGKVLSLRPFGAPLPLWRKRHLPRIGGVCLAEGGLSTV